MADSTPVAAVQSDGDQWIAALRAEILDGDKMSALVAARMAHIIRDQHPDAAGLGRVVIDAAVAALACRAWLERKAPGKPVTAAAFANLIGLAGIALIDQEEEAGRG